MPRRFLKLLLTAIALGLLTDHSVNAQESSWLRVFDDYYLSSVETAPFGILAGHFDTRVWLAPYNGIYLSRDLGETWEKLGLKDKGITWIKYSTNIYITTYYHTDTPPGLYVSKDRGITWEHSGPPYSANYIEEINGILFLGTEAWGLFVSFDKGLTWEQKISNIRVEAIQKKEGYLLASASNKTYQSQDGGITWNRINYTKLYNQQQYRDYLYTLKTDDIYENNIKTNLNLITQDMAITHTKPPYLFANVNGEGIYKYEIPQTLVEKYPFLEIPWNYATDNEFVDKITAYFDHEYPLLGQPYHQETGEDKNTTVNFLGMKEKPPVLYYSSHNGTDYSLPYGTNILAAADGIANYYWCNDCGNTVEIDHQNGYKTIYMHLADNNFTKVLNDTYIVKGTIIGAVGMTGNTTGPHLHFAVKKDGIIMDPYGWQNGEYKDPWETYEWEDTLGVHNGTQSPYLWNNPIKEAQQFINDTNTSIQLENKKVDFNNIASYINYTAMIKNYIKPNIHEMLNYVNNTSILITAIDLMGNKIKELPNIVEVSFDLNTLDLTRVISTSLKIYHFNNVINDWEPLETIVDLENNIVKANTNSFSHFALFGEPNYSYKYFHYKVRTKNTSFTVNTW